MALTVRSYMFKGFRYRIYPTKKQRILLDRHFGSIRFIYNWALDLKIKSYIQEKKQISCFDLIKLMVKLKKTKGFEWLNDMNSQSLQMSIRNLDNAFTHFFRRVKQKCEPFGFPKFKSKKNKQSFNCPQQTRIDFDKNTIWILKLHNIKTSIDRKFNGKIKTTTISKSRSGKYFASILVNLPENVKEKSKIIEETAIGIDLGIKHFITLSNGEKIDNERFNEKNKSKIIKLNKKLSKQLNLNGGKHTKNSQRTKIRLARIYEKVTNQRLDFLHKISSKLVGDNQTICVEDLCIKNMLKNHSMSGAISSLGWANFLNFLEYKCEWYGKNFIKIGRFEPSTKICSICGFYNENLTLKDREWECPDCKTIHDRDINAAKNIKTFALNKQNLIDNIGLDKPEFKLGEPKACRALA